MVSRRGVLMMGVAAALTGCAPGNSEGGGCLPGLPEPAEAVPPGGRQLPQPIVLSPDGSRAVSATSIGGSKGLPVWDVSTGTISAHRDEFTRGTPVWLDGSRVAWAVGADAAILDVDSGEATHLPLGHRLIEADDSPSLGSIGLAVSVDGATLASAGHDATLRLFGVATCSPGRVIELDFGPTQLSFTGRHLLVGGSDRVAVYDAATHEKVALLENDLRAPAIGTRDGSSVFMGATGEHGFASVDPRSWEIRMTYPDARALSAAVAPSGALLATFGTDAGVRLHDVARGGTPRSIELPSRTGGVVFLDDDRFLTVHLEEGLLEWDVATGEVKRSFDRP